MKKETLDQVRGIAADIFGVPANSLTEASSRESVESWDSMQHLNLVLALEQRFGVELEPDVVDEMKSLGAVARVIDRLRGEGDAEGGASAPAPPAARTGRLLEAVQARPGVNADRDANAFVTLFNATYARKIAAPYYTWRFFDAAVPSAVFLVDGGDGAKGVGGAHFTQLGGAARGRAALVVDVIVDAREQGTGLVLGAINRALEGAFATHDAKLIYAFPNARGANAWAAAGWTRLPVRVTYARPVEAIAPPAGVTVHPVTEFGSWVDAVASGFARAYPEHVFVQRTAASLNWRFCRHPLHKYEILQVRRGDAPAAYVVLKVFEDPATGRKVGDLVDLLWAAGAEDKTVLEATLGAGLSALAKRGVAEAQIWLDTNTLLDAVAKGIGFAETTNVRPFVCRVIEPQRMVDPARWFATMADSEVY